MSKSVDSSIYLEETNTEEVSKIIQNLENRKASDIPIAVIKRPAHLISKTLSRLYNNCMHSGLFPSVFKTGKVIPIYKKDNKECIENYRPVSILPVFGKIFEKIIYNRLYKFFTSRGILHDKQFGFRRGHSATHALHKSVDFITKSMSIKQEIFNQTKNFMFFADFTENRQNSITIKFKNSYLKLWRFNFISMLDGN